MRPHQALDPMAYIVDPEKIGFPFVYPDDYLEAIDLIQRAMVDHDGGLGVWILRPEAAMHLANVLSTDIPTRNLVPFARFDNGDWVAVLDANLPESIFVTNLGESPARLYEQEERTMTDFFRSVCKNLDLPWPASAERR